MSQTLMRILTPSALLAALALLAACGSDDEPETTTGAAGSDEPAASVGSDAAPTAVFTSFQSSLANGDAEAACAALAPSAIEQAEAASIGGTCKTWVSEVAGTLDPGSKEGLEATVVKDEKIKGEAATLTYTDPILDLPIEVELENIDGSWLISKLAAFV
jgi:hypothetical protein